MSCPYFSSKKPSKSPFPSKIALIPTDPSLFIAPASYSLPYISPYSKLLSKYSYSKTLNFTSFPFHVQNTFFHTSYITKSRSSEFLSKIAVANELREAGNCNYHKNHFEKAASCYEHALGLFQFIENISNSLFLVTPEIDSSDLSAANGMISKLLKNYALALIKMKNFENAWILIQEAKKFESKKKFLILEAVCKANNKETTLEIIEKYSDAVKNCKEIEEGFGEVIRNLYMEKCSFFKKFFDGFGKGTWGRNKTDFHFEVNVITKIDEKYLKMIEFYQDTETLKKVVEERNEIRRVYCEIENIIGLKHDGDDEILKGHAKVMGIELSEKKNIVKFENTKKSMIAEIFNKGNFNRSILYQCFQDTMTEFENCKDSDEDKIEKEYAFWKKKPDSCNHFICSSLFCNESQRF